MSGFINVGERPQTRPGKALAFAWLVEVVAVVMGLLLAAFAGIEGSDGGVVALSIATLPFAALSVIELTKLPLVGLAFQVRSLWWRLIAVAALLLVTAATFENFVFGFERGFNERIRSVEIAEQAVLTGERELQIANAHIPQLTTRQAEIMARLAALQEEIAGIRQQAQHDIQDVRTSNTAGSFATERARVEQEMAGLDQRREAALNSERARCRANPNTRCNVSAMAGSFGRQRDELSRRISRLTDEQRAQDATTGADVASARQRRDAQLAGLDRERKALGEELDGVRDRLATAQATALQGSEGVAQAARKRDEMMEKSQLHRLSMVLFGNHEKETVERTKRLFVVSLAAIVALVGSLIAAMHHAADNAAPRRRPLTNALRGYVARRRRAIPVRRRHGTAKERIGAVRNLRGWLARRRRSNLPVKVKEIVREVPIDRLKIVFLPLDATEEQVAQARRDARQEAA